MQTVTMAKKKIVPISSIIIKLTTRWLSPDGILILRTAYLDSFFRTEIKSKTQISLKLINKMLLNGKKREVVKWKMPVEHERGWGSNSSIRMNRLYSIKSTFHYKKCFIRASTRDLLSDTKWNMSYNNQFDISQSKSDSSSESNGSNSNAHQNDIKALRT